MTHLSVSPDLRTVASMELDSPAPTRLFPYEQYSPEIIAEHIGTSLGVALVGDHLGPIRARAAKKSAELLKERQEGRQFGIHNIREHMGIWSAPAEELRDYALDVQAEVMRAQNLAEALSDEDPEFPSPLAASFVPLHERMDKFHQDTCSLAAYDLMKLMTVEQQLEVQGEHAPSASEEFDINFTSVADKLGLEIDEFFMMCQDEKTGEHLFITPIRENEPYPDMLKRERKYLIHRLRKNLLRRDSLHGLLEREREKAIDDHAHQWAYLEHVMNVPSQPKIQAQARYAVNRAHAHAARYVKVRDEEETLSQLLSPEKSPLNKRPELHRQRTEQEIELRVARFTTENKSHLRRAQVGLDIVIAAEKQAANEEKQRQLNIVVGNFVDHVLPTLPTEDIIQTLSWLSGLNPEKGTLNEVAVFYLESNLRGVLGNALAKPMGAVARSLYDSLSTRPTQNAHQETDEIALLFGQGFNTAYGMIFPARPTSQLTSTPESIAA